MALTQIGGNTRHHRVIKFAGTNSDGQQQVEKGGQQRFHRRDAL